VFLKLEKYVEMILDAAETVLGSFGFDRTAYSNLKRNMMGAEGNGDGMKN
jgi:hypothetical protein